MFWHIYFIFYFLLSTVPTFVNNTPRLLQSIVDYTAIIDLVAECIVLVAFFSFISKKRLFSPTIWRVFLLLLLASVVYLNWSDIVYIYTFQNYEDLLYLGVGMLVYLPVAVMMWKLAFSEGITEDKKIEPKVAQSSPYATFFQSNTATTPQAPVPVSPQPVKKKQPPLPWKKIILEGIVTVMALTVIYHIYHPELFMRYLVNFKFSREKLAMVYNAPQPRNIDVERLKSINGEEYGYAGIFFRSPWTTYMNTMNPQDAQSGLAAINFQQNQATTAAVLIHTPPQPVQMVSQTLASMSAQLKKDRVITTTTPFNTNYDRVGWLLSVTPEKMIKKISFQQAKEYLIALAMKAAIFGTQGDKQIDSFAVGTIKGFSFVNGKMHTRTHHIVFFDQNDLGHELDIVGTNIPQDDIDYIISTLRFDPSVTVVTPSPDSQITTVQNPRVKFFTQGEVMIENAMSLQLISVSEAHGYIDAKFIFKNKSAEATTVQISKISMGDKTSRETNRDGFTGIPLSENETRTMDLYYKSMPSPPFIFRYTRTDGTETQLGEYSP
jgi:hypothetical protein